MSQGFAMDYEARAARRSVKNFVKGYTDAEVAVRDATSNDPWGAPKQLLVKLSDYTYEHTAFREVMEMLYKRLNDSGKNWRHVIKALTLLDYLIKNGNERVADFARNRVHELRTLKDFQYIDEQGKDQGSHIRHKAKEVAALLADPERIKEERAKARQLNERLSGATGAYTGGYGGSGGYDRGGYDYGYDQGGYDRPSVTSSGGSAPAASDSEDRDLQRALEESRQQYLREQERRRMEEQFVAASYDSALAPPAAATAARSTAAARPAVDDAFADFQSSAAAGAADPFGGAPFGAPAQPARPQQQPAAKAADPFADAFGAPPAAAAAAAADPFGGAPFGTSVAAAPAPARKQDLLDDIFGGSSSASSSQPSGSGFDAAFDGGREGKKLPHELAGKNDPNAMLANIARNAPQMDPFARHAASRTTATAAPAPAAPLQSAHMAIPQPAMGASVQGAPTPANSYTAAAPIASFGVSAGVPNPFSAPPQQPMMMAGGYYGAQQPMMMGAQQPMMQPMMMGAQQPIMRPMASTDPFAGMAAPLPATSSASRDPFAGLTATPASSSTAAARPVDPFASLTAGMVGSSTTSGQAANPFAQPKNNVPLAQLRQPAAPAVDPNADSIL